MRQLGISQGYIGIPNWDKYCQGKSKYKYSHCYSYNGFHRSSEPLHHVPDFIIIKNGNLMHHIIYGSGFFANFNHFEHMGWKNIAGMFSKRFSYFFTNLYIPAYSTLSELNEGIAHRFSHNIEAVQDGDPGRVKGFKNIRKPGDGNPPGNGTKNGNI